MLNPCIRCKHAERRIEGGYICDDSEKFIVEEGTLSACPYFDPINKTEPGANCDLYGKACMTCPGCPAEPPTEEEESEVWG